DLAVLQRAQHFGLGALQYGEIEPVGAAKSIKVDVRVVAATHRDLETEIEEGNFREDLFYRLNVIPMRTPPLREHMEDVPLMVDYFVRRYCEVNNYHRKTFSPDGIEHFQTLPFKGNVRELKNLVERLLILSPDDVITKTDILQVAGGGQAQLSESLLSIATLREFREHSERLYIVHQLEKHGWNVTQTAQAIDTPRSNLYKKMDQYDIQRDS
ncbi:MAG: sigma 54-interacting transcriptional regulator, partial [Acidobacteriota bacterium]